MSNDTGSSMRYIERGLFGGAITVRLPASFFDTSQIRDIPDNQEVYLDRDGFSSITFDILERVEEVSGDEQALLYHLFDIVDDGDRLCVTVPEPVSLAQLLVPAFSVVASTKPMPNRDGGKDLTVLIVMLVRLETQATDIVVSVNLPYRGKQFNQDVVDLVPEAGSGPEDEILATGLDIMKVIVQSLQIQDWGLFG